MHSIDLLFLAYCIYVPFLAVLYLLEIWVVLKPGSPFKSSFYILFVATALGDLTYTGCTFHELRMAFFPLVNRMFENYDCQLCAKIRLTISYILPFSQDCLNCFVALNRLTSILHPTSHERMWKILLPFAICFSYLLPIAIFTLPGFRTVFFDKIEPFNYAVYVLRFDLSYLPWFNAVIVTITEIVISSIAILIMYSIAAISLRKFIGSKESVKQERALLKIGIINFAIMTPLIFMQFVLGFRILSVDWTAVAFFQFGWLLDLKFFGASISMIVVNKSFREYLLISLRFKRPQKSVRFVSVTEGRIVHSRV